MGGVSEWVESVSGWSQSMGGVSQWASQSVGGVSQWVESVRGANHLTIKLDTLMKRANIQDSFRSPSLQKHRWSKQQKKVQGMKQSVLAAVISQLISTPFPRKTKV